ncbi:hypothetical protein ACT3SZ_15515 [Corynebacterium sp. AOP40-9SA-29]|uniref:hypothetical protein n=1 Tax=Corynebacterium sp. AOP40-9SA-29 TaxID=3457677 RepID=UPI0040341F23
MPESHPITAYPVRVAGDTNWDVYGVANHRVADPDTQVEITVSVHVSALTYLRLDHPIILTQETTNA